MGRQWLGLALATAAIVAGVVARGAFAPPWVWVAQNLVLAWAPVVIGWAAVRSRATLLTLGPVWWVFLPNAPYLLTDLVHLAPRAGVPLWFDVCLLGGLAALGLALGARSLAEVSAAVSRHVGPRAGLAAWLLTPPSCGLAMVLGRVQRFNSWDLATRPWAVLDAARDVALRPDQPELLAMAVVFATAVGAAAACVPPRHPADAAG